MSLSRTKYQKEWLTANPEKSAEYSKAYRERYPERMTERRKQDWIQNKEKRLETCKRYREKNPEKVKEASRKYREKTKESKWLERTIQACKARAKEKGLEFNLEVKDFIIPEICPVLGIPISLTATHKDFKPSFDKVDPSRGYVKGNVYIISGRANRIKTDSTADELEKIAFYVKTKTQ